MTKTKKKGSSSNQQQRQQPKKNSSSSLIFLTIGILAVIIVIVLGINNQNKPFEFDYAAMPVQGSVDAPVKIVEFGDYKCPVCRDFSQQIKPQLEKDYIETGKASFYFANYSFIGKDSVTAALAAEAVYQQNNDAFWTYNQAIYDNQQNENIEWATPEHLVQLAKDAKLPIDFDLLKSDIENKTYQKQVDRDNSLVRPLNIGGTPTVFINGKAVSSLDYATLKSTIEAALK
ncbi:DsbA family protein [Paenibacillus sp. Leaf72]|uniref:DsbA family protein n=1 Tax=Paenibacillus sp. Leaf72 TaxID=1736234 RepID=UPI0007017B0B|nr:thioredoxin domain-containing protein [Paenibacillus sp. Leaf72]KQO04318.1 disulfide bond formation protein DsbA [Paenibacillus sp. Leaf72]